MDWSNGRMSGHRQYNTSMPMDMLERNATSPRARRDPPRGGRRDVRGRRRRLYRGSRGALARGADGHSAGGGRAGRGALPRGRRPPARGRQRRPRFRGDPLLPLHPRPAGGGRHLRSHPERPGDDRPGPARIPRAADLRLRRALRHEPAGRRRSPRAGGRGRRPALGGPPRGRSLHQAGLGLASRGLRLVPRRVPPPREVRPYGLRRGDAGRAERPPQSAGRGAASSAGACRCPGSPIRWKTTSRRGSGRGRTSSRSRGGTFPRRR